jgi:hypothetical protein
VADPRNQLYESSNKQDEAREGALASEPTTCFSVKDGEITRLACPL